MLFLSRALSVALIAGLILLGLPGSAWAAVASRSTAAESSKTPAKSQKLPSANRSLATSGLAKSGAQARTGERAQSAGPQGFSEEQRRRYADKDAKDQKSDNYKGGVTLIVGGGVLVVALLIVLIVVLVD